MVDTVYSKLLPPIIATRIVWSLSGSFAKEESSRLNAAQTEDNLNRIVSESQSNDLERVYVTNAVSLMKAALRNLEIVYKGRELNFEENKKLRDTNMEAIKNDLAFGTKATDVLKTLPGLTIGGAGGLTVAQILNWNDLQLLAVVAFSSVIGFFGTIVYTDISRHRKQKLYVIQDYERNLYYERYLLSSRTILRSLYSDLLVLHDKVFGGRSPMEGGMKSIDDFLKGIKPGFCEHIHEHMRAGIIKPNYWPYCETGHYEDCPYHRKHKITFPTR